MKQNIVVKIGLLSSLLVAALSVAPSAAPKKEITVEELRGHVFYLASDALHGRKAGTADANIAADYIRRQFKKYGLECLAEKGFQSFEILNGVESGAYNAMSFNGVSATPGTDFVPLNFSESDSLNAPVVFADYGFDINADSLTWHDYQNLDVAGKWVMVLRDGPPAPGGQDPYEAHRSLRKKLLNAKDKGAAGVLLVSGPATDAEDTLIPIDENPTTSTAGIIALHIKRALADRILASSHHTIAELEQQLLEKKQPAGFALGETLFGRADVIRRMSPTSNVIARLPGHDPALKNEYIVLGAHYDHLGMGGPGSGSRRPDTLAVHNGADDNASGVAAMLEIAENLAARKKELGRSMLFIAFTAEEEGTLGSRYFTDHPLIDLKKIMMMINLDMVGHLNDSTKAFSISGTGTAVGLSDLVQNFAAKHLLHPTLSPEGYGPSDHASFYSKDIPVLFFMTSITDSYHTPADDAELLNYPGAKIVADLVADLIIDLSNHTPSLVYQEAGPKSQPVSSRRFKVSLGIMPDFVSSGIKGVRAESVLPGRPGARAGMKKGDVIVALDGKPVNDIYEYMNRLADFRAGQRVSLEVLRDGKKEILIVEF